jgi:flagellar protein FlaG
MSSDISAINNTGTNPAPFGVAAGQPAPAPLPGSRPDPQPAAPDVLQRAAQRVVAAMEDGGVSFDFTIDKQSGLTIVRIFNKATGELVRQIPSEEAVHVAQLLRQDEQRSLLDLKV